ncbi:hypothetical protein L7F22_016142 [Adiantum nelumboides]|nr:hypothetical protein [Adiantum nelumboides]
MEDKSINECENKQWQLRAKDFAPGNEDQASIQSASISHHKALHTPSCLTPVCHGKQAKLESYYNKQNEILKEMTILDGLADSDQGLESAPDDQANTIGKEIFAIRVSNYANMAIFAIKVYVSIRSLSMAIIASTLDSLLDLLSGFILWYTSHNMRRPNPYLYPIGKNRMQPVGILVFASIMATLGLQILIESTRQLISKSNRLELQGANKYWVIGAMLFVTLVKFNLMLLCKAVKNDIVQAYAQDHFFDVITNVVGLAAALLAERFYWWIDPVGAILLALYTIWNWSKTVLENVSALVGESAPPQFLQKITYLCWNHHEAIKHIDTIKAYKLGGLYFAEVDIVLPGDMPLLLAHDIGESLQNKLECLPDIERAFVHLDYEFFHRPEHATKKFIG